MGVAFGFIYMGAGYSLLANRVETRSYDGRAVFVGVGTLEEACLAAEQMVGDGVQLIELCGAFGETGVKAVRDAVDGAVPIGHVVYGAEEKSKLERLFPNESPAKNP